MSATARKKAPNAEDIRARKGTEPLVSLTAYTTPMARLMDAHCDFVLVGDSVGMVLHGLTSTLGVTMDMMIMHGQAVARGLDRAMMVIDMPFASYEHDPAQAGAGSSDRDRRPADAGGPGDRRPGRDRRRHGEDPDRPLHRGQLRQVRPLPRRHGHSGALHRPHRPQPMPRAGVPLPDPV